MISRDCDGCSQIKACILRYQRVVKGEKVYCPDGTAHLVDCSSRNGVLINSQVEMIQ